MIPRFTALLTLLMMALSFAFSARAETMRALPVALNAQITVQTDYVTLGDLFGPGVARAEKSVTTAPDPGRKAVLDADWLAAVASANSIDWRPRSRFDRAVVFRPGKAVEADLILDAVRAHLRDRGMSRHVGLTLDRPLTPLMIDAHATPEIRVLDTLHNPDAARFSALVEIATADDNVLTTLTLTGPTFAVVTVPVLKDNAEKNTLITRDMLIEREIPESSFNPAYATDPTEILGRAVAGYIRAGEPITPQELVYISFVELPVLSRDMARDTEITEDDLTLARFDERDLPDHLLRDASQVLGMTARRYLPAGVPLRPTDVFAANPIQIPVAMRDIRRGDRVGHDDVAWVTVNESELRTGVITEPDEIIGREAIRTVRAGRPVFENQVRRPIVIERGETITIRLITPQMTLTAVGRALNDAGKGETIEIMNLQSRKRLLATVEGPQLVSVDAAPRMSF